jgi:hypothetical protein
MRAASAGDPHEELTKRIVELADMRQHTHPRKGATQ